MVRIRSNSSGEGSSGSQYGRAYTISQPTPKFSPSPPTKQFRKMYLAAVAALANGVCMGLVLGYSSPAIHSLELPCSYFQLQKLQEPWFGSVMAIGALFGGLCGGPATGYFGRKESLMLCSMLLSFGWLIIPFTNTIELLYVARILTGFSTGLISSAAPMYVVEIATAEVRGFLGSCFQLSVVIGVLIVMSMGYYLTWEWLAVCCSALSAFALISLTPMPKSPRWLVSKSRKVEAIAAIKFLQGNHVDPEKECQKIEVELQSQPQGNIHFRDMRDPCVWKSFTLSFGLMYFQQFSGVNAIMFYVSQIFGSTGSTLNSEVSSIIIAAVQVASTFLGCVLMDKAGRKLLLIIGGSGTSISLSTMGLYFYLVKLHGKSFQDSYSWMALVSLMVFISCFSIGLGPIPWLMVAEMVPQRARSLITALATCFNWTLVFIVTSTFTAMTKSLHSYGAYWFYGCNCVLCVLFSAFLLPETKGKTLEDIQKIFSGRLPKGKQPLGSTVSVKELVEH